MDSSPRAISVSVSLFFGEGGRACTRDFCLSKVWNLRMTVRLECGVLEELGPLQVCVTAIFRFEAFGIVQQEGAKRVPK
jgi:hypothetical protein